MFYKALPNGKYRYYEKYFNEQEGKWKQVSVTLTAKSRQAQAQARRFLEEKIATAQATKQLIISNRVADLIQEWLAIRYQELKESTYYSQLNIVKQFNQTFGQYRLEQVTSAQLQHYLLSSPNWSKSYRSLHKTIICLFFDYCCKIGYLSENPIKSVVLPKEKQNIEQLTKQREKFLSKEDMATYLTYLRKHGCNPVTNRLIEFLYLTGLRSGEAFALTWDCVDWQTKTVSIRYTLYYRRGTKDYYRTSPKTLSGYRTVALSAQAIEILLELKETASSDFIFVSQRGEPYQLATLNAYLRSTFTRSGISKHDGFRLTSHVLRHSHISLLVEMDIPLRLIMERVGHCDEKTTLKVYTHVTQAMKTKLTQKLDDFRI